MEQQGTGRAGTGTIQRDMDLSVPAFVVHQQRLGAQVGGQRMAVQHFRKRARDDREHEHKYRCGMSPAMVHGVSM